MPKSVAELNACSKEEFVAALANVFEYSPWIAEQASAARPFGRVKPQFEAI
jgi:2-oxo-4-hydroxy-4-carboxy-5-ureidoimidazoline decarboxylase